MLSRAIFGWHLDGPRFPDEPSLGQIAVGPNGLIAQLCLRFGLLRPFQPQAIRIGEYLSRLKALDDGERFYSRSFQTDPWGTARSLLSLRDQLTASGWRPGTAPGGSDSLKRLQTFCALESGGLDSKLISAMDLLPELALMLESAHKPFLRELIVIDRIDLLPPIWQRIVHALHKSGVTLSAHQTPTDRKGDIALLSAALDLQQRRAQLSGDGSFAIIEGDDEVQCAEMMASWLQGVNTEGTAIIRGSSTSFVDQLLRRRQLPTLGSNSTSPLRGYAQLLSLALELGWTPISPARLLELLTLPYSPIPAFAADCFIFVLRNQPGIGGDAWKQAWTTAIERKRTAFERRGQDQGDMAIILAETEAQWRAWLEPSTHSASAGMPAVQAVAICKRVRAHSLQSYQIHDHEVFSQTATWAETLASAIEASGVERITRAQMDRMLESAMGGGYAADQPQASLWAGVDHPGQIYAQADTVFWWGFVGSMQQPRSSPWSVDEIQYLKDNGVSMDTPSANIVRESLAWRRPLLLSKRLILIKPRTVAGRAVPVHPFFHELAEHVGAAPAAVRRQIVRQAHELYFNSDLTMCGTAITRALIQPCALPAAQPLWQIGSGLIPPRIESASSLERLLACPLSWVLQYVAKLRQGNLLSAIDTDRLSGNLAHAVFAKVFSADDVLVGQDIGALAEIAFDELLPQVALPLLLPGKSLERSRLRNTVSDAATHLGAMLAKAEFSGIHCEVEQAGIADNIEFVGRADMLLTDKDGSDVVIDLKLAGKTSPRRKELSEGRAVQLALYAWMNSLKTGRHTFGGYYMVGQKQLLCSGANPFPQHTHVQGRTLEETFAEAIANYKQHIVHLERGSICATGVDVISNVELRLDRARSLSDDEPTIMPMPIEGISLALEPPCKICSFGKLCGKRGLMQ